MHAPAPPQSLLTDLRSLPRAFWVLFAGTFINRFGTFVWPFLTIYLTRQGYSLGAVGWVVSSFGLGAFTGSTVGGWMSDHFGRRNTIVLGTFASATFVMLLYAATSLPAIIACTTLTGLAVGTYHPAASALLADLVPHGSACAPTRRSGSRRMRDLHSAWRSAACWRITIVLALRRRCPDDGALRRHRARVLPHGCARRRRRRGADALHSLRSDRAFHALWTAAFCSAHLRAIWLDLLLHITRIGLTFDVPGLPLARDRLRPAARLEWRADRADGTAAHIVDAALRRAPRDGARLCAERRRLRPERIRALDLAFWLAMTVFTVGEMISAPMTGAYVAKLAPERLRGRYMGFSA